MAANLLSPRENHRIPRTAHGHAEPVVAARGRSYRGPYRGGPLLLGVYFLHGEADTTLAINFKNLNLDLVAFGQLVTDFLDTLVGDL